MVLLMVSIFYTLSLWRKILNFEVINLSLFRLLEIGLRSFPEIFQMKEMAKEVSECYFSWFAFSFFAFVILPKNKTDDHLFLLQMAGRILVLQSTSLSDFTQQLVTGFRCLNWLKFLCASNYSVIALMFYAELDSSLLEFFANVICSSVCNKSKYHFSKTK